MPALAPVPVDVARLTYAGYQGSAPWTLGFWLSMPGSDAASDAQLEELAAFLDLYAIALVSSCCSDTTELRSRSLDLVRVGGIQSARGYLAQPGGHTTHTTAPMCSSTYWHTGQAGQRGHWLTHVPGVPYAWTIADAWLSDEGIATTEFRLAAFQNAADDYSTAAIPVVRLCSLQRRSHGAALDRSIVMFPSSLRTAQRLSTQVKRLHDAQRRPFSLG